MNFQRIPLWPDRTDVVLTTYLYAGMIPFPDGLPFPDAPTPAPPVEFMAPAKKPAVLVCPGGAYLFVDENGGEGDQIATRFFSAGYQTFVLEYTVAGKAKGANTTYPAQMLDMAKAFLTIRQHADEWNVDPERISVCGFSAGAHLCGTWATGWHAPFLAETFHVDSANFRPQSAMLIYPLTDYTVQEAFNEAVSDSTMMRLSNRSIFGEEKPDYDRQCQLSSCMHVDEHTCPIFMAHAVDDDLVPVMHSIHMAEACIRQGIPCEMHLFEHGGHGFGAGLDPMAPHLLSRAHPCSQWLPLALTWLEGRS